MTTNYATKPITEPTTPRKPVARIVAAIVAGAIAIGGIFAALVLVYGPVNMNPPDGKFPSGGKIDGARVRRSEASAGGAGAAQLLRRPDRRLPQPADEAGDHRSTARGGPCRRPVR